MGMWTLLLLFAFGFMLFSSGFGNVTTIEKDYELQMGSHPLPMSYYIMLSMGTVGGGLAIGSMLEMHKRIEAAKDCDT
jgi:hypothetical protein